LLYLYLLSNVIMNIYLVGFMGTGKTSVGRQLAKEKGWNFVDLDELIELKEQRKIVDIFANSGEPYFRKVEKNILKQVATQNKFVVACGGGIVLDKDNIKLMKKNGTVICLCATCAEILKRTSGSTHRPILNVKKPKERIELLLKMRAPYYMQADKIIDTSGLSVKQVVGKISKILPKNK
jgi:shikimate kinase